MKRSGKVIAGALICLGVGAIGLGFSLPAALGDGVDRYNEMVVGQSLSYETYEVPGTVTGLRITQSDGRWSSIQIKGSQDGMIRLQVPDNGLYRQPVSVNQSGDQATITFGSPEMQKLSKENISKMWLASNFGYSMILEVPDTVTILSDENDGIHFYLDRSAAPVNAEILGEYGFQPSEEYLKREEENRREEALREENERLRQELEAWQENAEMVMVTPEVTVIPKEEGEMAEVEGYPLEQLKEEGLMPFIPLSINIVDDEETLALRGELIRRRIHLRSDLEQVLMEEVPNGMDEYDAENYYFDGTSQLSQLETEIRDRRTSQLMEYFEGQGLSQQRCEEIRYWVLTITDLETPLRDAQDRIYLEQAKKRSGLDTDPAVLDTLIRREEEIREGMERDMGQLLALGFDWQTGLGEPQPLPQQEEPVQENPQVS